MDEPASDLIPHEQEYSSMLVVRARKSEESEMKLECLTPEFPQGARVYSVDGVAPSLLNSASAMRSQAILVSGGGQHENL